MNGLLLVNLGTPDSPTPRAVRRYLREFLSDPRVLDMHPAARALLLHLVILPFRSRRSAAAYRKIWDGGSPLLRHGLALRDAVRVELGREWAVELAMRYGNPPIAEGLTRLRAAGCDRIVAVPLYPQFAVASTGSTLEAVEREATRLDLRLPLAAIGPFFDEPGFLEAFAEVGAPVLARARPDHVLFSFHGLPERHIRRGDRTGRHCLVAADCCDRLTDLNRDCYRAQCHATARGIAERLGLDAGRYSVAFQSRLDRDGWIRPYTDHVLPTLPERGCARVVVFCPAFVADCLETVEEIGLTAAASFVRAGGEALTLVPSLNDHPRWVRTLADLARRAPDPGRSWKALRALG